MTPEVSADEDINLHEFYERERIRFIGAFLALLAIAILYNFSFGLTGAYDNWLYDNIVSLTMGALAIAAISFSNRKIQIIIAFVLALMSTQFLITASHIVEASPVPPTITAPFGDDTP